MGNNSTKINKVNNHSTPELIEYKKEHEKYQRKIVPV